MCEALEELMEDKLQERERQGIEQGIEQGIIGLIRKKIQKGIKAEECANMLELSLIFVENIYQLLIQYPELNDEQIYQIYSKNE